MEPDQGVNMLRVQNFYDQSQGHEFDIEVSEHVGGYTFQLKIAGLPDLHPSDDVFTTLEQARQAAREQAWLLIDQVVKCER